MVDTLVLEANVERRESSSLSWGTILKHTAEVGSVRQGDPIAYVVSMFQYGKEFKGGLTSCRRLAAYEE